MSDKEIEAFHIPKGTRDSDRVAEDIIKALVDCLDDQTFTHNGAVCTVRRFGDKGVDVEAMAIAMYEAEPEPDGIARYSGDKKVSQDLPWGRLSAISRGKWIRRAEYAAAALQTPRSDTSAAELVRELAETLKIYANRDLFAGSFYPSGHSEAEKALTKAEQWLKKQGA